MIPVYILLGIIAIGVLLMSEGGKNILGWFILLAIIGVILFIGLIIWSLLSNKDMQNAILTVVGYIGIAGAIIYIIVKAYKKYKQGKFSKQAIKVKAIEIWQIDKQFIIVTSSVILSLIIVWLIGFIIRTLSR